MSEGEHVSGEENSQLSEVLKYVDQHRSAVHAFWECDKRIADLAEKLAARMPELRGRAALETWLLGEEMWFTSETLPRIDVVRLHRLIDETAEQEETTRLRRLRDGSQVNARRLRANISPAWEELARHSVEANHALVMFRELPHSKSWPHPCPTLDELDPIIALIRRVIAGPSEQALRQML